jgi:endonuclease YncB( thermonuclease family)
VSRRRKSTTYSILVLVISLFIWYGQSQGWLASAVDHLEDNQPGYYNVTRYSDGDTLSVNMNGTEETIRFIGVDTPETHDPRKPVQCYGPAASSFTKNIVTAAGSRVRLAADSFSDNRDRYNRLLRYVYLSDGTMLNLKLIRDGYGFYYPYFKFSKSPEFDAAQKSARKENKGVWGNCTPKPTDGGGWVSNDQDAQL